MIPKKDGTFVEKAFWLYMRQPLYTVIPLDSVSQCMNDRSRESVCLTFSLFGWRVPIFHHFYVSDANFGVHPCIQMAARHSLIFICARACRGTEAMRRSIRVGCTWCMQ